MIIQEKQLRKIIREVLLEEQYSLNKTNESLQHLAAIAAGQKLKNKNRKSDKTRHSSSTMPVNNSAIMSALQALIAAGGIGLLSNAAIDQLTQTDNVDQYELPAYSSSNSARSNSPSAESKTDPYIQSLSPELQKALEKYHKAQIMKVHGAAPQRSHKKRLKDEAIKDATKNLEKLGIKDAEAEYNKYKEAMSLSDSISSYNY